MIPWKRAMKRLIDRAREYRREPNMTNANLLNDAIAAASRLIDIAEGQPMLPGIEPEKEVNELTSNKKTR